MHEYSLTQSMIENILTGATPIKEKKSKDILLGVGVFSHENFENINFWWKQLIAGTKLDGWKLIKQDIPGKIFCSDCKKEYLIKESSVKVTSDIINVFSCPQCNSIQTEILEGNEIIILENNVVIH